MKNIKKKELLYNAVSGISSDIITDSVNYEAALPDNTEKAGAYKPTLRIIGAFALLAVVCGGTFAGLKYLEYKGGVASGLPETKATEISDTETPQTTVAEIFGTETEAPSEQKMPVFFRLTKKIRKRSGNETETVYEYDEYGRIIKETETENNGTIKAIKNTVEYTYDGIGNIVKKHSETKENGSYSITDNENEYTADGRIASSYVTSKTYNGTTEYGEIYKYDGNRRIIRMEQTLKSTGNESKTIYDYVYTDENGSYILTSENELMTVTLNEKGLVVKGVSKINGKEHITQYKYDEYGKIIEMTENGVILTEASYTYDKTVVTKEELTSYIAGKAVKTCMICEYDEYNNLIRNTTQSETGKTTEEITYEWEPVYEYEAVKKLAIVTYPDKSSDPDANTDVDRPITANGIEEALQKYNGSDAVIRINVNDYTVLSDISEMLDKLGYDELTDNMNHKIHLYDYNKGVVLKVNSNNIPSEAIYDLMNSYHVTSITVYPAAFNN